MPFGFVIHPATNEAHPSRERFSIHSLSHVLFTMQCTFYKTSRKALIFVAFFVVKADQRVILALWAAKDAHLGVINALHAITQTFAMLYNTSLAFWKR